MVLLSARTTGGTPVLAPDWPLQAELDGHEDVKAHLHNGHR